MTNDAFKNICEGVKNIALVLSMVAGGLWAVFEYRDLLRSDTAKVFLELQTAELKAKWDQHGASIDTSLVVSNILHDGELRYIAVDAILKNTGSRGTTLDISDAPLRIAKVSADTNASIEIGSIREYNRIKLRGRKEMSDGGGAVSNVTHIIMLPGQSKIVPFVVALTDSGIYYVEFRATLDAAAQQFWTNSFAPSALNKNWSISKYIYVQ